MSNDCHIEALLERAKSGDLPALGELLETYRSYLRILARQHLYCCLKSKFSASDIVQETFLRAHRGFHLFEGQTERELLAWLRRILARRLSNVVRHYGTLRRSYELERQIEEDLDQSSQMLGQLAGVQESPSENILRRERALLLAMALDRLKPEYHEVIELRHVQGEPFVEVAKAMGRTVNSVKQLWARAIAQLRDELREL